jgi:predicted TIM-barrel fold metal-dependent hydrolase
MKIASWEVLVDKVLMISADGHVAPPMSGYREYVDPKYRSAFDEFAVRHEAELGGSRISPPPAFFDAKQIDPYLDYMVRSGAIDGEFDVERRLMELEKEGVVAEVLFPNNLLPFQSRGGDADPELVAAGRRAYNRWLVDFVSSHPERFIGQVLVGFDDVDAAVADIEWAAANGLRGVMLPGIDPGKRLHWDPALDRFWSAMEDTGIVGNIHGGSGLQLGEKVPDGLNVRVVMRVLGMEFPYYAHRPFFFMVWSGVFERHPRLRTVWTEQYSSWIPRALEALDWRWENDRKYDGALLEFCPRRPSEYWRQNCWAGMSLASKAEIGLLPQIGYDKGMFGVDFPHLESSYPNTLNTVRYLVEDLSDEQARDFLGMNSARLYGLDLAALAPIVEEVGPSIAQLRTPRPANITLNDEVYRPAAAL